MLRRQRSDFTLIELLVVISIIVLLMVLLLPALSRAKEAARRTACLSNTHQINIGLQGYMADSDGFLPPTQGGQNAGSTFQITNGLEYKVNQVQDGNSGRYWHGVGLLYAYDYVNDPNLVYCPSQRFDLFTYPIGWEGGCTTEGMPCEYNFRYTGYYYRIFGQWYDQAGVTPEDVERLRKIRLPE